MFFYPSRPCRTAHAAALLCACSALAVSPATFAQGVATEQQLEAIIVKGKASPRLDPNLPSNTASRSADELESQNIFNPEDAFRYFPSTVVRKRHFGDRNANVAGRSHGVLEPGRALVYLDGYLISQFLGRFDAPRWIMVNNESIERVDALYGPFSAIYPGNSIGTTLVVTERAPKGFEASASFKLNRQQFSEYGTQDNFRGTMMSARIANRLPNGLWFSLAAQHQNANSHPMGYANALRGSAGQFGAATAGTRVTGIYRDIDPNGADRALFGANGIDHTVQTSVNARLGYSISATQELSGRISSWRNKSQVSVVNYLRDAAGNPVWTGVVNDGINSFNLATTGSPLTPSKRDEDNCQMGITWKTLHAKGWNASVVATQFDVLDDAARSTALIDPVAQNGGVGLVTRRNGTGWKTFEVQAAYKPFAGDFGDGRHAITVGYHQNHYTLNNVVRDASDWRNNETTLNQSYSGSTHVRALYAQNAWSATEDLLLTVGVRAEAFEQRNGFQFDKLLTGVPNQSVNYANRSLSATSPKFSAVWAASDDWQLKTSFGKGTRFPNVDEMFNGTRTGTSQLINNPNLRPEVSSAFELSGERFFASGSVRMSLFRDDVQDAILRQSDTTVTPTTTRNTNVDRVLTNGLEVVAKFSNVGVAGLDISGNATYADARIKENKLAPATEGKFWLRIPRQRYAAQLSYRPDDLWTLGANYRWQGRNYNTPLNTDANPETFGGISHVNQLDISVRRKFGPSWSLAVGIDNLLATPAWQAHTMPQRSLQAEVRYAIR